MSKAQNRFILSDSLCVTNQTSFALLCRQKAIRQ